MKKFILFGLLLITACELVVDIDIPLERQQLTVNSFFTSDSVWRAKLSLNRHVLDDAPFPPVENASVVIYHENLPVDTLVHNGEGHYASENDRPLPGQRYELRASSNAGNVSSESFLPAMSNVTDVRLTVPADPSSLAKTTITLRLHDRAGEENFYQVFMIIEYTFVHPHTGETHVNKGTMNLISKDPSIDDENLDNGEGLFFSDAFFAGETISITLEADQGWFNPDADVRYLLYVRTVSADFYEYKTSAMLQNQVSGDPFAQPVVVYNNVVGGFGIFAGYSQAEFILEP